MAYIFLDESGDLGFKKNKRSSRFFVVTIIFSEDKRPLEKIARRVHKGLAKKYKKIGTLHAHREEPNIRRKVLRQLHEIDCSILAIVLDKNKVFTKMEDEKVVLYNYITNILLGNFFNKKPIPTNRIVSLIASQRETNKFFNKNFQDYVRQQAKMKHGTVINVTIATPEQEFALQIVDFASWAIFRKYESNDDSYFNIIKSKIIDEALLYP